MIDGKRVTVHALVATSAILALSSLIARGLLADRDWDPWAPWTEPGLMAIEISLLVCLGWLSTIVGTLASKRPRAMTRAEAAHYWGRPNTKPPYLSWPGQPPPKPPIQKFAEWAPVRMTRGWRRSARAAVSAVPVLALTFALVSVASSPAIAAEGQVLRVVDGDTVDLLIDGTEVRVRLLYIDAPENNRVTGKTACMGPESYEALRTLIPTGSAVEVRFDSYRKDRYGRLLASLSDASGRDVAVELVRRGLASPRQYAGNGTPPASLRAAAIAAQMSSSGVYSPEQACSPANFLAKHTPATASEAVSSADLASALAVLLASKAALEPSFVESFAAQLSWFGDGEWIYFEELRRAKNSALASAIAAQELLVERASAREEAERAEAEADVTGGQRVGEVPPPATPPSPQPPTAGWPSDDGYTGCRDYSGVGMVDDNGRLFAPIPCP